MSDWRERKVVIVGAARQGTALARYLAQHGAEVILNDNRAAGALETTVESLTNLLGKGPGRIDLALGGHPLSLLDGAALVCPSGGVPLTLPLIEEAVRRGIGLSNDSQIFLEAAPCRVVGITGSAGKTTTTTLVGRMAQAAVEDDQAGIRKAWVGGNIGQPLIAEVDAMHPNDLAVMELSSFQTELMTRSPQVAAILNITPNHLDRHGTMEAYTAAKARLLQFQQPGDLAVLGREDPGAWALASQVKGDLLSFGVQEPGPEVEGTYRLGNTLRLRRRRPRGGKMEDQVLMERREIGLRGEHNVLNVLAASAIAAAAGLPVGAMRQGVQGFRGVAHRLEYVRTWGGADWYNDSIATAPERAMAAIRSFDEPLILLAGGRDKNLPWEAFAALARRRVDRLILFGEAAGLIAAALERSPGESSPGDSPPNIKPEIMICEGLKQAVQAAAQVVRPGDVVLLSPGGTSFDEFRDFEERGLCFAQWVRELPGEANEPG